MNIETWTNKQQPTKKKQNKTKQNKHNKNNNGTILHPAAPHIKSTITAQEQHNNDTYPSQLKETK